MNRKQLVILTVIVAVVGAAGWLRYRQNRNSWEAQNKTIGQKMLGDLPINDVAAILIKSGTNEVNLERKQDRWRVRERKDYPANYSQISQFLLKAQDLKVAQSEPVGPSLLGRYQLLPPGQGTNSATLVEFRDAKGKTLRTLLLGKAHMHKTEQSAPSPMGEDEGYPDGRYVMVGTSAKNVDVIADPLGNMEASPGQWLNKDFIRIQKVSSISAACPVATNSWKLTRPGETSDWTLVDAKPGEQLDSTKTSSLANALGMPSFSDVDTGASPAALGLDKPTVLTLTTFDGFTYTVDVGTKTNDIYPMTVKVSADFPKERTPGKDEKPDVKARLDKQFNDNLKKLQDQLAQEKACEGWTYLVSSWTLDPLMKTRSELLVEKKDEAKKDTKPATALTDPKKPTPATLSTTAKAK